MLDVFGKTQNEIDKIEVIVYLLLTKVRGFMSLYWRYDSVPTSCWDER